MDKTTTIKESMIKHNSQKYFDNEIFEAIKNPDKYII